MFGQIDISGRINEWNKHSYLAFSTDKKQHIVFIDVKTKDAIQRKYGNITDFVQKFHSLIIYYCIRDSLDIFKKLQICSDCGKSKILKYLKDYFYNNQKYDKIKKYVKAVGKSSDVHKLLKKARKYNYYDLKITYSMISRKIK